MRFLHAEVCIQKDNFNLLRQCDNVMFYILKLNKLMTSLCATFYLIVGLDGLHLLSRRKKELNFLTQELGLDKYKVSDQIDVKKQNPR